jgi:hypothetical protein
MVRLSSTMRSLSAAVAASVLLAGCGGGDGQPPTGPNPNPGPGGGGGGGNPVRTVLMAGVPFVLAPDAVMVRNVDNPPAGTLDVTVNWPGGGDLNLYVTPDSCTSFSDLRGNRCQVLARAEGTSKPESASFTTTASRTYTVWIHNNSGSRESGAFDVAITTAGPIPAPTPTPSDDPKAGLAPGPVARVALYIYQVRQSNGVYRDKFQDSQGRWILHPGEFVVFDSTQLNANGDKCQWNRDPEYSLSDPQQVLSVRGSSQPFLYRVDVVRPGQFTLQSTIDGITSAPLRAISE